MMCDLQQAAPLRRQRIPIKETFILCDVPITLLKNKRSRRMFVPARV